MLNFTVLAQLCAQLCITMMHDLLSRWGVYQLMEFAYELCMLHEAGKAHLHPMRLQMNRRNLDCEDVVQLTSLHLVAGHATMVNLIALHVPSHV